MLCLERLFVDNNEYSSRLGYGDEFVEALYPRLYSPKVEDKYRLLGRISTPDFMTLVTCFINVSLGDKHPRFTLDDYVYKLQHNESKELSAIAALEILTKKNGVTYVDAKGQKKGVKYEHIDDGVVECVLWASYVYCYILEFLEPENAKAKRATTTLYNMLFEFNKYIDKVSFEENHYLMVRKNRVGKRFLKNLLEAGKVDHPENAEENTVSEDKITNDDTVNSLEILEYVRPLEAVALPRWKERTQELWMSIISNNELRLNFVAGLREKDKTFSKKFVGCIIGTLRGRVYEDDVIKILVALGESTSESTIRKYIYDKLEATETPQGRTDYNQCAKIVKKLSK